MEFTEKYFMEELGRFRANFTNKEWMALPEEKRDAAIRGLSLVYLNVMNDDGTPPSHEQVKKWGMWFDQAITEYNRRQAYILLRGLTGKPKHFGGMLGGCPK